MLKRFGFVCCLLLLWVSVSVVGAQSEATQTHWWNDRVFYEIFVRSFSDSDGDGTGDIQGIIDRLDYLNDGDPTTTTDLGITGLWLMPIFESPSYHGYDVTNYSRVEPDYGSFSDFRRLVQEAHNRGIAVIIDLVINHTSSRHPWFVASSQQIPPYADYYVWSDTNPGFRGADGQTVWYPRGGRFFYAAFWDQMPDLNLNSSAVTREVRNIARNWMTVTGLDGFRLDGIKWLIENGDETANTQSTMGWLLGYHQYIRSINPNALLVGEVWDSDFVSSEYVPRQVDLTFDFDLAGAILNAARQRRPDPVLTILRRLDNLYPPNQFASFITNHDQNRVMSQLQGDAEAARVAASLLLTTPGVPFLYYGEEIGMTGVKPDEQIRTPMRWDSTPITAGFTTADEPWEPISTDDASVNVADQSADPNSLLSYYRLLIHLRSEHPALAHGSLTLIPIQGSRNVTAFLRQTDEETLLVVINLNNEAVSDYTLQYEGDLTFNGGEVIFGASDGFQPVTNSLTDYAPFATLPAQSTTIIDLSAS
ncbi:MAG: alpha-amylase family glycosyl hydrolase [Anaerolineae bacterium]